MERKPKRVCYYVDDNFERNVSQIVGFAERRNRSDAVIYAVETVAGMLRSEVRLPATAATVSAILPKKAQG
jgi:hypothetical protein